MSNLLEKKNVLKVKKFLKNIDDNFELIVLDETARTAEDAARSLKKEVGAIVKSLFFKNEETNEFYLCLVSGDQYISEEKLKEIHEDALTSSGKKLSRPEPVVYDESSARVGISEREYCGTSI